MSIPFEPYTAQVRFTARPALDAEAVRALLAGLLETVARCCQSAGARLIGHIKCLADFDGGFLRGNLTDFGRPADVAGEVQAPISHMDVLLLVLVYGLNAEQVDRCVKEAVDHAASAPALRGEYTWLCHDHLTHAHDP